MNITKELSPKTEQNVDVSTLAAYLVGVRKCRPYLDLVGVEDGDERVRNELVEAGQERLHLLGDARPEAPLDDQTTT